MRAPDSTAHPQFPHIVQKKSGRATIYRLDRPGRVEFRVATYNTEGRRIMRSFPTFKVGWLSQAAGIPWKHNALRHSFISYRLAEVQSVDRVALEAGNSPAMIFKHYRELVTAAQAAAWFGVVPALRS